MRNYLKFTTILVAVSTLCGCTTYRTNSETSFESVNIPHKNSHILISESLLSDKKYTVVGSIEAEIKKLGLFNQNPTKEMANYILIEKAERLKADAVVDVKYDSGIGFTTWGYITAKGIAVKFIP